MPTTKGIMGEGSGRAEHRWPAAASVVVALLLYGLLPSTFLPIVRYSVIVISGLLLIVVIAINPLRLERQTRTFRIASIVLTTVLALANLVALVQLIQMLIFASSDDSGALLLAAAQVWATNVIVFALIYWELDRGGPVTRSTAKRADLPDADIRFPQDEDADAVIEVARGSSVKSNWTAGYVDYLYFSLSNAMAFSPPDAMPLSARAKLLVGAQALAGFVILVFVIARAVSLLG